MFRPVMGWVICWVACAAVLADDFEMVEPDGRVAARVEVHHQQMMVYERTGQRILFDREPRYDSLDGRFAGYFNLELNRIVRFPRSGFGRMMSADLDDAAPNYRVMRRTVRPAGVRPAGIHRPNPGFGVPGFGSLGYGIPAGLVPWIPTPGFGPVYPIGPPLPQSVLVDAQTIAHPPLSPVRVQLRNGGPRDIQVGLVDRSQSSATRVMRIPPSDAVEVMVQRDSGARLVQNFRVITPFGDVADRQVVSEVPPAVRYEIVVHQWQIQSVAIDRTAGAGADPIEDINFHGASIGRFPLPPGAELTSGSIDVYNTARQQGNAGSVAPILATEDEDLDAGPSLIERAILEAQQNAQRAR
ncbi:hypothetical protein K227x_00880 [Rubripirellula lacrimiformis]|uniref:Uncharacterized protein n=1 Tax=Rubripirellula lacrimiformis TaxID=1930273 RepID=A0A517N3K3_9BACT|nr:hypothetical protein [Rubripirellula lacrimiformis]QDT01721.1 hypothetical protein K227x_00880 [Rubripirellula lacrimiformis]